MLIIYSFKYSVQILKPITYLFILLFIVNNVTLNAELLPFYQNSYALVIGINSYPEPSLDNLTNAVSDAQAMAEFLSNQGFDMITLLNEQATRLSILSQMQNNLANKVKENDRVIFFFAGHGYTEELSGTEYGYIVPYDANKSSASYLSMEELQTQSKKMGRAKHHLFIMDCCFGGLLATRDIAAQTDIPNYIEKVTSRYARQILTAGGKKERVVDGSKNHSLFTRSVLEALAQSNADQNFDGYITFSELYSYVLTRANNAIQTPGSGFIPGHGQGEFVFKSPAGSAQILQSSQPENNKKFRSKTIKPAKKILPTLKKTNNKPGDTFKEKHSGIEFIWIPGGCFSMGCGKWSEPCSKFEKPEQKVCVDGFWMGKTEVTQGQWKSIMKDNPAANDSDDNYPVEMVSWIEVNDFIDQLNQKKTKGTYRLPTEAEWEYACRSRGKKEKYAGDNQPNKVAWYSDNSKQQSHPVAQKQPNSIQLYDMSGNVREWCQDIFSTNAYMHMKHMQMNPVYQGNASGRVIRGGGWCLKDFYSRCTARHGMKPTDISSFVGFRLVKEE